MRGEEVAEARRHADAFARGLRAAWAAHRAGRAELPLDDRDAEENARAEALIRYLVRPELASVQTDDVAPEHYRYRIQVDWAGLRAVAERAQVDLERLLR